MKLSKLPRAIADLVETAEFLANDDPNVADSFFDAFEATIEEIRKVPKIGTVRRFHDGVPIRMWFVRGFEKSLIFYTENADEVVILRIIHAARDYTRFFEKE